jgi:DNA mismatch repair protein MSH2
VGAKECLLPADAGSADLARLTQIAERAGLLVTHRKRSEFATRDIKGDLTRLLKPTQAVLTLPQLDLAHAMAALAALITYLEVLRVEKKNKIDFMLLEIFNAPSSLSLGVVGCS